MVVFRGTYNALSNPKVASCIINPKIKDMLLNELQKRKWVITDRCNNKIIMKHPNGGTIDLDNTKCLITQVDNILNVINLINETEDIVDNV